MVNMCINRNKENAFGLASGHSKSKGSMTSKSHLQITKNTINNYF